MGCALFYRCYNVEYMTSPTTGGVVERPLILGLLFLVCFAFGVILGRWLLPPLPVDRSVERQAAIDNIMQQTLPPEVMLERQALIAEIMKQEQMAVNSSATTSILWDAIQ